MVPINTAGNWFQQIQREKQNNKESVPTNMAKIGFDQYSGTYLREIVPTNMAGHWFQSIRQKIGSNQYNGKSRTTWNWFLPIWQGIGFNQYNGKYFAQKSSTQYGRKLVPVNTAGNWFQSIQQENKRIGNWFQPIRQEIGLDKCSGKIFVQDSSNQYGKCLVQFQVAMTDKEDNRIKSTRTWIKWNNLVDGTSMKYGNKLFAKPEQCKQLKIELKQRMKNNDEANAREASTYCRRRVE